MENSTKEHLMNNFTPFRLLDKNEQRSFVVNFGGLTGGWFNKVYAGIVAKKGVPSDTSDWTYVHLKQTIEDALRWRSKVLFEQRDIYREKLIDLFRQAHAAKMKEQRKNDLIAESHGKLDFAAIKNAFCNVLYIEQHSKRPHKAYLVTGVNKNGTRRYSNCAADLDNKPYYTIDEVKTVVDKLVALHVDFYQYRIAKMNDIATAAHNIGV